MRMSADPRAPGNRLLLDGDDTTPAALFDRLTGLGSRTLLVHRLAQCLAARRLRPETRFALLSLDLDRFQRINDAFGPATGDWVLQEIATRLHQALRDAGVRCDAAAPARTGGDEFLVLLEEVGAVSDTLRVAEQLLRTLAVPHLLEGEETCVTASIGITTSDRDYAAAEDMLRDANLALRRAKATGRTRCVVFDRSMHVEVARQLSIENRLRAAIEADRVGLHYQPVVRLRDGALVGFEALVRWTDPQLGPLPATEVIATAEESGLIIPLGLAILRTACHQLHAWHLQFETARPLTMSVNLSPRQLETRDLVGNVGRILAESGLRPTSLVLEITETAPLSGFDAAVETFLALRRRGIGLHLDDFGTGYSSLGCLHRLPLTAIKIDRAFTQEIGVRPAQMRVLEAIVAIARALQLGVTVEGIETPVQMATLRRLGVDQGQGYHFGKPVPPEQILELLQTPEPFAELVRVSR